MVEQPPLPLPQSLVRIHARVPSNAINRVSATERKPSNCPCCSNTCTIILKHGKEMFRCHRVQQVPDLVVAWNLMDAKQTADIAFPFAAFHHALVCQTRRGTRSTRSRLHLPSYSGCSCQCVCPVARTVAGEKNRLLCQTIPVLATALALLALSDVLTIRAFPGLEQLFAKMRIAGKHQILF